MRRNSKLLAVALILLGCPSVGAAPPPPNAADAAAALVGAGGNVFTISCSSSYCHGAGGVGARGPSLQNRVFPPDYVRDTILQGRPGTPMPSFKNTFRPDEIAALVAYVKSLSPDSGASAAATGPVQAPASKQALAGSDLFFDETRPAACSVCHSYGGAGGPIGPDLAAISAKSPRDIYQRLLHPASGDPDYPAVTVTMRDGGKYVGIERDERQGSVRLYDVSALPPVLRTLPKADIAKVEPLAGAPAYEHDVRAYSEQDLLALVDFLKSGAPNAPAELKPQDLGPR
jgi:putative heme-binding domain-containing protein